jgi:ribosomal protein S18 acetylase RimI-like enzyme
MKILSIALCNESDLATLVELNRLQMLEEKGVISVSDPEIREGLLIRQRQGLSAYFLKWGDEIVGFATVDTAQKPYSLKSFYASRNFRRSGMKSLNFSKLVEMLETDILEVEVYASNTSSRFFWETFGFKERKVCLHYSKVK